MKIILEEVEGNIYGDIILSPRELDKMRFGEMVESKSFFRMKDLYIGVRMHGAWEEDYEEDEKICED